jgi:PAS domain S-box-containing protein
MVRDTDKVKSTDEKHNKKSSKRVNHLGEELEVSRDEPRSDDFLQVSQNPWLNLTLRYLTSVMAVVIAFWLYFFITSILGPGLPTYILFYPAVIIVAILAGFGPGLLATIFSVLLVATWILEPRGELSIITTVDQVGAVLFTGFGILISGVSELYRRNRIKAAAYDREEALRETLREKEFLANILEESSQPFAIGYPDGRLGLLNHAFEQLTGYTKEELNTIDWSTILTPVEWLEMEKQKLDELHRTGQPVRYEKEYIRKVGSIVPIELLVNIFLDKEGNPEYYYSFITDITKRKRAEEDLKRQAALLDLSYEAIFSWDYDGGIISWNHGAERLYGFNSKEAVGSISHDLIKTKFPIPFTEFTEILIKDKIWTGELTHTTKDGREIIVESRQQLINNASNNNIVLETNRDITERKKTEKKMNKTMGELERSNQELERFAYVSSHDLQEPLRMITLYSQLLERRYRDSLDSDADDFIEYIVENAKRMKQLIDDLLSFSRVNTDVKDFMYVDLEAVLDSVLSSLAMSIEEFNINITHDPLPSLLADSTQMVQVFQNLLINAIKFRGEEPPEIHISAEKGEGEWTFSISDNGIGIKPEHQKQIFEVFKRLHTREEYPGTGIGLSICQKIIRHHGGRIWLESELGKGTTFYFTIPYS